MTFHALAYAIVHPKKASCTTGTEGETQGLSRALQQVIDYDLCEPASRAQIRELMLAHFRDSVASNCRGFTTKAKKSFAIAHLCHDKSIGGEYVKSYGEKIIADFLFEHDVAYKYERNHWWRGINYRPDFTIFKSAAKGRERRN